MAIREYRFSILLYSLPREDYRTNIDTFDSQSNLNLDYAIIVLREKKVSLQAEESTNWAKVKSKLKKEKEREDKDKYKDKGKDKFSKKGYRAFTAGSSLEDDSTSSSEDNEEKKVGYKTAALSKKLIGKPSSFVTF